MGSGSGQAEASLHEIKVEEGGNEDPGIRENPGNSGKETGNIMVELGEPDSEMLLVK